jgi:hypothetical protein
VVKADIVKRLVENSGVSRDKAEQVCDALFHALKGAVARGERIELPSLMLKCRPLVIQTEGVIGWARAASHTVRRRALGVTAGAGVAPPRSAMSAAAKVS